MRARALQVDGAGRAADRGAAGAAPRLVRARVGAPARLPRVGALRLLRQPHLLPARAPHVGPRPQDDDDGAQRRARPRLRDAHGRADHVARGLWLQRTPRVLRPVHLRQGERARRRPQPAAAAAQGAQRLPGRSARGRRHRPAACSWERGLNLRGGESDSAAHAVRSSLCVQRSVHHRHRRAVPQESEPSAAATFGLNSASNFKGLPV